MAGRRQDLPVALSLLRFLLTFLVAACILGLAGVAAVFFVLSSDRGGVWDAFLADLALLAGLVILVVMVVAGMTLRLIRRSPVTGASFAVAYGVGLCLVSLVVALALGSIIAGGFLLAGLPVATLGAIGLAQLTGAPDQT
ncbi:hypothetical protein [Aeromicrobium sp.]|uniref:hypothetical protein n=1 Tax=Aeromicrobium sp. TaxID=1871063 RepID=UPI0030C609DD